jgi:hypothetical protein
MNNLGLQAGEFKKGLSTRAQKPINRKNVEIWLK